MHPIAAAPVSSQSPQMCPTRDSDAPGRLPANALRHGLRSGSVLVPGDDAASFRTLRHRLFHLHQPRTIEEALCVETLAAGHWRMARCRREQGIFKHHLGAALGGHPEASGYLCGPDPHRLHHRGMDCSLEETRLERSLSRARNTLGHLQRQRTESSAQGRPFPLEDYRVFLAEGESVSEPPVTPQSESQPAAPPEPVAASVADPVAQATDGDAPQRRTAQPALRVTGSSGAQIGKIDERDARHPTAPLPPVRTGTDGQG